MIPLFLGLTLANLLSLLMVFVLGLDAKVAGEPTASYEKHVAMAVFAGLLAVAVHVIVYTYFMATTKWLAAATDKAGLDAKVFIDLPQRRKKQVLLMVLGAVSLTMATMFAGAATDIGRAPQGLHLTLACILLLGHSSIAWLEFQAIRRQGRIMDAALAILNQDPSRSSSSIGSCPDR